MKRLAIIAAAVILLTPAATVRAQEPELIKMHTTAYCQGHKTATGKKPRKGIAAVNKERLGKTALIYKADDDGTPGELIGIWECEDTGKGSDTDGDGIGAIEAGWVIDIYQPTLEDCNDWMKETGGLVYVQFIDARG